MGEGHILVSSVNYSLSIKCLFFCLIIKKYIYIFSEAKKGGYAHAVSFHEVPGSLLPYLVSSTCNHR